MPARTPYYITTAISYPNGPPHIGHAYEVIATDAIARFMRLDGYDVFFLTGTDEHGQKIQQTAAREGLTPRQLLDRNVPLFEAMVKRLECSNTDFIHTTERRHHISSEAIWQRMHEAGDIYLDKYSGWYSVRDEAYYAEDETELSEQNGRVAIKTGTPVEWVAEESYFFRLSAYQDKLLKLYAAAELCVAEGAAERSRKLRARRPAGSVHLAHDIRLGRSRPRKQRPHHVCVGRRAHELHHRRRLSGHRE